MKLLQTMSATNDQAEGLILRLTLGVFMLPHGLQLLFGWFGGYGFSASMAMFTGVVHLPWIIAFLAILITSLGSVLLILGVWGRLMALLEGIFLLGALLTVHLHVGFFMNWNGNLHGEGFEFHLLGIGIAIALLVTGSGRFSVDRLLSRQAASIEKNFHTTKKTNIYA